MTASQTKAHFIEPMLLLRTDKLPEGTNWAYELKLDGYRAIAFKSGGRVHFRSRNNKDFNGSYPAIVKALSAMPDETVIDGEIVALDEQPGSAEFRFSETLRFLGVWAVGLVRLSPAHRIIPFTSYPGFLVGRQ
jgi:bifunctional non-homologous end joining protein LigD